MLVEENRTLAPFTTLGIGGPARWFVEAHSEFEVAEAAAWARDKRITLFVLGGGSNLVVADAGFPGVVLHIGLRGIDRHDLPNSEVLYRVASGEDWDQFVQHTVQADCAGLECLAGIPGTIGGTPVQNVGAYGQEVATVIDRVHVFDLDQHDFSELAPSECEFAYRRSRFNTRDRGRFVVTRVDYRLKLSGPPMLTYQDLQRAFPAHSNPSLKDVAETVRRIRQSKGMLLVDGDPDCRSAGSFFKNPIVSAERAAAVGIIGGAEPPQFFAGPGNEGCVKLPAGWLIEKAGFVKGYAFGKAAISTRHTLALVNLGGATAAEIVALADTIRTCVAERFGIDLEMEPVMLGFDAAN